MLEEHLYAGEHEDGVAADMYPGYLVLLTSAAGATLTHRLASAGRLSRVAAWALHCVFASKLTMLLVPEARPANGAQSANDIPLLDTSISESHCHQATRHFVANRPEDPCMVT